MACHALLNPLRTKTLPNSSLFVEPLEACCHPLRAAPSYIKTLKHVYVCIIAGGRVGCVVVAANAALQPVQDLLTLNTASPGPGTARSYTDRETDRHEGCWRVGGPDKEAGRMGWERGLKRGAARRGGHGINNPNMVGRTD